MIVKPGNVLILFCFLFFSSAILGNLLYMNPYVSGLYARYTGHPGIKPWQEFGSIQTFVMMNMAAGVVLNVIYILLFSLLRNKLPEQALVAGLVFSVLVILVKAAPEAWNQYLNFSYPKVLILTQFINSSIGIFVMGAVISLVWRKWPAVVSEAL